MYEVRVSVSMYARTYEHSFELVELSQTSSFYDALSAFYSLVESAQI